METHQDSFHKTLFNTLLLDCGHYLPDIAKSLKIDEIKSHILVFMIDFPVTLFNGEHLVSAPELHIDAS